MYQFNKKIPFSDKISRFNVEEIYSSRNRFVFHALMWGFFSFLLFFNYRLELKLSLESSILMTIRGTVNNMTVFYTFFYFFVPRIFKIKSWGAFFIILSIPLSVIIWLSVNYFQFKIFFYLNISIEEGPFKDIIANNAKQTYAQALSFDTILGNAMLVFYACSPAFFVKTLFDITRLFNKTIFLQKQSTELHLQNLEIEKDFLKAQLNPHFLFNTLNNLYGLVVAKSPKAPDVIINISDIMAYTLYESNTEKVSLKKELTFIENYFALEKMRYSSDKDISLLISISDDIDGVSIAPLLTFIFIENAFKYGLKTSKGNFLHVCINISDNIFYISIENNKDVSFHKKSDLGGIGLNNIKKRLNLLYPENHKLILKDMEETFYVSLSINLLKNE